MTHLQDFINQAELIEKYGENNAYLAWVMALFLDLDDIDELATNSITDGSNDKKIDFIYLDSEDGVITFAQGYYSKTLSKDTAKGNKASDLNTAAAWFWSGDLQTVPQNLRNILEECRKEIKNQNISVINVVYVHNLPESETIQEELKTSKNYLNETLKEYDVNVNSYELGITNIENLYINKYSQILIKEDQVMDGKPLYQLSSDNWSAYIFSVSGEWLYSVYQKYGNDLFSANYRGFLGVNKRKKINNRIKSSAEYSPHDFWAFNNGITMLTSDVHPNEEGNTVLSGISIINGAQTTGSISSIDTSRLENLKEIKVLCRVIKCKNPEIKNRIVEANNMQNAITSWDTYSNDPDQLRIQKEFETLNKPYSLKRGFENADSPLGISTVIQPLLAFEGNYQEANRGKNSIFENIRLCKSIFDSRKARHLLLAYSLSKSIDIIKSDLKSKYINNQLIEIDAKKYSMLNNLKFKMFLISMIGRSFSTIIGKIVSLTQVAYAPNFTANDLNTIEEASVKIIDTLLSLISGIINLEDLPKYISDQDKYNELVGKLIPQIQITKSLAKAIFDEYSSYISLS